MLKTLKEGDPFPMDFWNYRVNHITGFNIPKPDTQNRKMELKYNKTPQSL